MLEEKKTYREKKKERSNIGLRGRKKRCTSILISILKVSFFIDAKF